MISAALHEKANIFFLFETDFVLACTYSTSGSETGHCAFSLSEKSLRFPPLLLI